MTRKERIAIPIIGAVLLLIFTFADLPIALSLHAKNLYGIIFEIIGELPFAFLAALGCAMLLRFTNRQKKLPGILLSILSALLMVLFSVMGGFMLWNYAHEFAPGLPQLLSFVIAFLLCACAMLLAWRVPGGNRPQAMAFGLIAVLYFVLVILVMNLIKSVWGRMRIRDMTDPLTEFTRWYVITPRGGFNNVYASFPSGHAMNAAGTMLLCLLAGVLPGLRGREGYLKAFAYCWILIVGASRVVMGAHFASDVVAGALLSLLLFELLRCAVCRARGITFA